MRIPELRRRVEHSPFRIDLLQIDVILIAFPVAHKVSHNLIRCQLVRIILWRGNRCHQISRRMVEKSFTRLVGAKSSVVIAVVVQILSRFLWRDGLGHFPSKSLLSTHDPNWALGPLVRLSFEYKFGRFHHSWLSIFTYINLKRSWWITSLLILSWIFVIIVWSTDR